MKTAFTFELRVVACELCGAPLTVGPAGGRQECRFCGEARQAGAVSRDAVRVTADVEGRAVAARSAARKALAHLFVGADLLPWKVPEASALWKAARSVRDDDRLLILSLALAQHFENARDPMRQRAILDGALEELADPAQRQLLYAALCRGAARAGDFTAAEAWLSRCDPKPRGVESDTAYRFSRAYLDTLVGRDFQRVLETVGPSSRELMLHGDHEPECIALRANAWERLGRADASVEVLDELNLRGSSFDRYACARFVERHQDVGLCSASFAEADARQRARGVKLATKAAGAPLLAFALTAGAAAIGVVLFVLLGLLVDVGTAYGSAGIAFLLATVFFAIFVVDFGKARRAARIRGKGVQAVARVIHGRGTNQVTNGIPQLLYRVLVLPATGLPFEAHSVFHADRAMRARFVPGALVVVRMDPSDHRTVQLELD